jgi:RNA polymerase sigma factor (sigma-70 family)
MDGMNRLLLHLNRILRTAEPLSDGQLLAQYIRVRDEEAFRLLVQRYGPLVLGVCRRWLPNHADRDDAFQATFLVLARRANSISHPERLGSWLHSVAWRTARKLRFQQDRQRRFEQPRCTPPEVPVAPITPTCDLGQLLDEELGRLPERFRLAMLLCHVQGLSRREAAVRLNIPEGTLSIWLNRATSLMRKRLIRRGIVPVVALPLLAAEADAVPPELFRTATNAAISFTHQAATIPASATVVRLAQGVLRMLLVKRLTAASATIFLVFFLGAGIGLFLNEQVRRPSFAADPAPKSSGKVEGLQIEIHYTAAPFSLQYVVAEKEDRISVNSAAALGRYLKRLRAAEKTLPDSITIVANADTKYSIVADVLLACKEAGFRAQMATLGQGKNVDDGLSRSASADKAREQMLARLEALQEQRDSLLLKLRELEGTGEDPPATFTKGDQARQKYERDLLAQLDKRYEQTWREKESPPLPSSPIDKAIGLRELEARVVQAESELQIRHADLKAAEANLQAGMAKLERMKQMAKAKFISAAEIDEAALEVKALQAAIERAQAQLKPAEAQLSLEKARLERQLAMQQQYEKSKLPLAEPPPRGALPADNELLLKEAQASLVQAEATMQVARAGLKAAEAELHAAVATLDRMKRLVEQKAAAREELDKAQSDVKLREAASEKAQAELKHAESQLQLEKFRLERMHKSSKDSEKPHTEKNADPYRPNYSDEQEQNLNKPKKEGPVDEGEQVRQGAVIEQNKLYLPDHELLDYRRREAASALAKMADDREAAALAKLAADKQTKDLAPFQGVWKAVEVLAGDKAVQHPQQLRSFDWIVIDNRIVHIVDGQAKIGSIRVSHPAGKTQIGVTPDSQASASNTISAFVEFEGDKMKLKFPASADPNHPGLTVTLQRQDVEKESKTKPKGN